MELAYVSGKYRGSSPSEIYKNINTARETAIKLWKKGYAVLCPHMNTAFLDGVVPDLTFLEADIEMLSRCDFIVIMEGWQESKGAKEEVKYAKENQIPIYKFVKGDKLSPVIIMD
jgi:hypothetical protein